VVVVAMVMLSCGGSGWRMVLVVVVVMAIGLSGCGGGVVVVCSGVGVVVGVGVRTWWWLPENQKTERSGAIRRLICTSFESCNERISSHQERRGREDVSTAHTCDTMLEMEATIAPGLDCNTMSCAVTVICRNDMRCAERFEDAPIPTIMNNSMHGKDARMREHHHSSGGWH
jgi:hypothetical protein